MNNRQKGVSLIELLIVIIVLGIIASISVAAVGQIVENTRVDADEANAVRLNQATRLFHVSNPEREDFSDNSNTSKELMTILNETGFIDKMVEPQTKDGEYSWDFDNQVWLYSGQYVLSGDAVSDFDPSFFGGNAIEGPYSGSQDDIVIPDIIDGNEIYDIYQDAFRFGDEYSQTQLKAVSFTQNSSLTHIHARAFKDNAITSISFPQSLERIDYGAFLGNDTLTSISIGDSVELESDVFRGMDSFKDVYETGGAGDYYWDGSEWLKQQ